MEQALKNQIRRLNKKLEQLEKLSSRISTLRLFDVIFGLVVVYFAAKTESLWFFVTILILALASFIALVQYHRKIDYWIGQISGWIEIRKGHLARKNLNWDEISQIQQQDSYENHPFAQDLDITGKHSLLQLMNTAVYPGSISNLEKYLLKRESDLQQLEKRQRLVKKLKPMAHFRDRLHLNASLARKKHKEDDWKMEDLLLWLQSIKKIGFQTPLIILGSLAVINITLLVLYLTGVTGPYVIFTFIVYALIYNFYSSKSSSLFGEAQQINKLLSQFRPVLLYLEGFPYKKNSELKKLCEPFHSADRKPSNFIKRIIRITSAASSQDNEFAWLLLNILMPWDLYFAKKLNDYKSDLDKNLSVWLERFYTLEALNSIANFAWLNDDYIFSFPKTEPSAPVFTAQKLGHPLIPNDRKVTNNLTIENNGDILLITGSNMSGKSTFLRTLGINLCLCFAGAPVNARTFQTVPFRIFSSINVTDSLDEGLSHFYAEVKHLRKLLNKLNDKNKLPLFYMVDEIYRGTNNKERLTGSEAFLKKVAERNGVGLVSTHDMELAQLENEIDSLSNWHFEETIEDGKMRFEYKLKPGPCPTTNALKIMDMEGLPI